MSKYFSAQKYRQRAYSVWFKPEDASVLAKSMIYDFGKEPDVLSVLDNGKEWLFSELTRFQPLTGKLLQESGELFVGGAYPLRPPNKNGLSPKGKLYLYLEVHGQLVQVGVPRPSIMRRQTMADDLPVEIREAYYRKGVMDGLVLSDDVIPQPSGRFLPIPIASGWAIINHWAEWLNLTEYEFRGVIDALDLQRDTDGNIYDLRSFLVHVPTGGYDYSESDILFLDKTKHRIIHMKNGDISTMRVLENYVDAIDKYCVHTILGKPDRFDFEPYLAQEKIIS
ncbi:hypothetical protein [Microbulbifer harenosus]|uniref:Uncharacterized protein n=2 Tax=Microbulbifer harenosus TaxID=2576840 RepID=A0ABY2UNF7_9GAMM|nr:hypothetical protein [Microbulbifer harenosus]TLM80015.1 hypothetical protein FDY93_01170 [Microbulbifer harenosus]